MPGLATAWKEGGATSDRITVANAVANQDLTAFTILFAGNPNDISTGRTMLQKGSNAANSVRVLVLSGSTGNVQTGIRRATTSTTYVTSDTPLAIINRNYYIIATVDIAATPVAHIYVGTDTKPLVESAYGTATDGSGAPPSDAASSLFLGNNFANAAPWSGMVWAFGYLNYVLPRADGLAWQKNLLLGRQFSRGGRGGYWLPGLHGTGTVLDQSGANNSGTFTGGSPFPAALPHSIKVA